MMMKEIGCLQRCLSVSNQLCTPRNQFRYRCILSLVSRKTLNPNIPQNVAAPLISHSKNSSSRDSSPGSSPFLSFESFPPQENSITSNSRYRPFSIFGYGSDSFGKGQSFRSSLSGSFSNCCSNLYLSSLISRKGNSYYIHRSFTDSSSKGTVMSSSVVDSEVHNAADVSSSEQKLKNTYTYPPNVVSEVIDIVRNCEEDLESRLNMLSSRLTVDSITSIFEVLNTQRISGLRFFEWLRSNNHRLRRNGIICSLIVDNMGRLEDFESMFALLKTFTSETICLSHEAFRFLPIIASTNSSLNESTQRVVGLLNKVGGSCRNSGVHALIGMFCKSNSFEMARYVIKITESRISYYCILIREKCKSGLVEDAHGIIFEMKENHCAPNTSVYNYLLGSLGKNGKMDEAIGLLEEIREFDIPPNEITYEILINSVCSLERMDDAHKLLDQMVSHGIKPRTTTLARVVKTLFADEKYEVAHEFVAGSSCKTSSNMMYSLMANLYREKGDILSARDVLLEMMEKCLKPNFRVYVKIVKGLVRSGRANLVEDLESRHEKFVVKSRA